MTASGARSGVRQGHVKSALDGGSWFGGASQGRDSYREVLSGTAAPLGPSRGLVQRERDYNPSRCWWVPTVPKGGLGPLRSRFVLRYSAAIMPR
jgi:hypothetical protein